MHTPPLSSPVWALGQMSGTSLDALDLALILTDGEKIYRYGAWKSIAFPESLALALHRLMQGVGDALRLEHDYTLFTSECVNTFLNGQTIEKQDIAVLGFHGQTIMHRPKEGITWQLGNPSLLAERTGVPVVADFRRRDMAAGGQGAPLVPVYHAALAAAFPKPLAIVNIGGVANITYVGEDKASLLAWDTGPGNSLLNDWVYAQTGEAYDANGQYAGAGNVNQKIVSAYLSDDYFAAQPPKSLDRNHFSTDLIKGLSLADGAATLTAFTIEAIVKAQDFFPQPPLQWLICGGGRHNATMMQQLQAWLAQPVINVEALGWRGDALEAEAFAYLAVRSLQGLPLSLPGTTGVHSPTTGGAYYA